MEHVLYVLLHHFFGQQRHILHILSAIVCVFTMLDATVFMLETEVSALMHVSLKYKNQQRQLLN